METSEAWIARQAKDPEFRQFYEEERLILWTTEEIAGAMVDQGISRADIAERIGTSRANVTQLLSGSRNMTLRSLARLAYACGMRAVIQLEDMADSVFTPAEDHATASHAIPMKFSTEDLPPELPFDSSVLSPVSVDSENSADILPLSDRLAA
ncbi:MAG: helix-turn-helix transcriptional regulator [Gemmatimonadota bacterium]|nr:helix-turn-helix transcriptional regulator [Gemmatimonadota bacterium]MDE2985002.1 helix-turn-helix transcriptional regulator [Gemmatimonadota bacterium]